MNATAESRTPSLEASGTPIIKIIGVGGAGVSLLELLTHEEFAGAAKVAVNTDRASLAASSAAVKVYLEGQELRGFGTGGDAERGFAIAEENYSALRNACEGANVVLLMAGLGGGAGSGITPVIARAARETGALVLAFVTVPFECEGNRRRDQARKGLELIKCESDGVICLPNQKAVKLIDENTSVMDTFRISGGLLVEAVRGVWQLMTRPGLIQIHLSDLCALVRDKNSEGVFAYVETSGPARSREAVEKLLAHPLLDDGRALTESDAVLVSLMAGHDLTMAEVNRVMEQIGRQCERAQVIMGAAVDEAWKGRLAVTVIAARHGQPAAEETPEAKTPRGGRSAARTATPNGLPAQRDHAARPHVPPLRRKPTDGKYRQESLPLVIISKGLFDKSEPTIHKGEDLDIPTYYRRGVPLN